MDLNTIPIHFLTVIKSLILLSAVLVTGEMVFTARHYASVVLCPVHLSVRHKLVLCQKDWTNRAVLGM